MRSFTSVTHPIRACIAVGASLLPMRWQDTMKVPRVALEEEVVKKAVTRTLLDLLRTHGAFHLVPSRPKTNMLRPLRLHIQSPMFFSNVIPAFQQPKVGPSSYWSVQEVGAFPRYLENFGTDWQSIASYIGTKSQLMVRNTTMLAYIPRLEACARCIPTQNSKSLFQVLDANYHCRSRTTIIG